MNDSSRTQGGLICIGVVIVGAWFLLALLQQSYWAIAIPVAVLVFFVLGLTFWIGYTITFTAGALNGESQVISDYNMTDGEVTVAMAFTGAPGAGNPFTVTPSISVPTVRGTLLIIQGAPV